MCVYLQLYFQGTLMTSLMRSNNEDQLHVNMQSAFKHPFNTTMVTDLPSIPNAVDFSLLFQSIFIHDIGYILIYEPETKRFKEIK